MLGELYDLAQCVMIIFVERPVGIQPENGGASNPEARRPWSAEASHLAR